MALLAISAAGRKPPLRTLLRMAGVASAVGEFAGAVRGVLILSRPGRVRSHIRETLTLVDLMDGKNGLDPARTDLVRVVTIQSARLLALVDDDRPRSWDWGSALIAIVFAAFVGWVGVWAYRVHGWFDLGVPETIVRWTIILSTAIVGAACLSVGWDRLLGRKPPMPG